MSQPRSLGGARPFLHHLTQLLGVKESLLPSDTRTAAWLTARQLTSHTSLPQWITSASKTRARENSMTRSFIFYTPRQMLLERSCQVGWNGSVMWHAWGRREMHIRVWLKRLKKSDQLEEVRVNGYLRTWYNSSVKEQVTAFCGYSDEHSNSLKYPKFLSSWGRCQLVEEDSDLWS